MAQFKDKKGFTLIETIVAIFIFAIFASAIFGTFTFVTRTLRSQQMQLTATTIAAEQLEIVRNLSYENVGTIGGIPKGTLSREQTITKENTDYKVEIEVRGIDDPFDGTIGGSPNDPIPEDYKRARVIVSWNGPFGSKTIQALTDISRRGLETTEGGGTLMIRAFDANAKPINGADVTIKNTAADPKIDLLTKTNSEGNAVFPGAPASINSYEISVTKKDYSKDETHAVSESLTNPEKPHASVFEKQLTIISFAIDLLSTLQINFVDEEGEDLASDIPFALTGSKTIGSTANPKPPPDTMPVLKYPLKDFIAEDGGKRIPNLEWDTYNLKETSPDFDFAGSSPLLPINLLPNTTERVRIELAPHETNTLLIEVTDLSGSPINGAEVSLTGPEKTQKKTSSWGAAFFSPIISGDYEMTITHPSFTDLKQNIGVSGQTKERLVLTPKS